MDGESRKLLRRYPPMVGLDCRDVLSAETKSCGGSHPTPRRLASTMPSVSGRSPTNPGAGNSTGGRVDGRAAVALATHSWLNTTAQDGAHTEQEQDIKGGPPAKEQGLAATILNEWLKEHPRVSID